MEILKRLAGLKNLFWAFGILISLVALLVALVFAMFTRFSDPTEDSDILAVSADSSGIDGGLSFGGSGSGTLYVAGETNDAGQAYIDSLTFLCDSSTIGLRDYGVLTNGIETDQVWGSSSGTLPILGVNEALIVYPGTQEQMTAQEAAELKKPSRLLVSIGMDSLAGVTREQFISSYEELLNAIHDVSPNTVLICCTLTSITSAYTGSAVTDAASVAEANEWLKQVCMDTGAYYMDISDAVCEASTTMYQQYAAANNKQLNSAGLTQVLQYIRTHAI